MATGPQQNQGTTRRDMPANEPAEGPGAFGAVLPPGMVARSGRPAGRTLFGGVPVAWVGFAVALLVVIGVLGLATFLISQGNSLPGAPPAASPGAGSPTSGAAASPGSSLQLGSLVTAGAIDTTNRPTLTTNVFTPTETIYAVLPVSQVPAGTTFFARWRHEDQVFEDSSLLTAPQAYANNYIEFHLRANPGQTLPPGNYTVAIYVDGVPRATARFAVQ